MAFRFSDERLEGRLALLAPLQGAEALTWDGSEWADISVRWEFVWGHSSGAAALSGRLLAGDAAPAGCGCLSCALSDKLAYDAKDQPTTVAAPASPADDGPQFVGDAIGDNTSSTTTIAVGSSLSSLIDHANDLDYIKVNLVAGQTYTFSLYGGTLNDPYVELRNSAGVLVAEDDDGGAAFNAFLMYRATTTGEYWIVARHFSTGTGTYTLDVNAIQTGNSSPTSFIDNGKPYFSWEEAAIQITRDGRSWASDFGTSVVVTYAYRSSAPLTMPEDTTGFSRFNAAQITATEASLAAWAAVANITFVRVNDGDGYSNNATILFANYNDGAEGAAAFAFLPGQTPNTAASSSQGDVWINVSIDYNANPVRGDYGYQVLLHEIGHAIGLRHPADYNAGEGVTITYQDHAVYFQDSRVFTTMTYFGSSFVGGNLGAFASLPQMHDIAAVQRLYGANLSTRTGNTTYGYNSNTGVPEYTLSGANAVAVFTIWDGGGLDLLDLSGYTTTNTIDLREEAFSSVGGSIYNISIARGSVIENAIGGSGADTIIGNSAANTLTGGGGNDTLTGGFSADTINGGAGNDTINYAIGDGADAIDGGADTDTLNITDGAAGAILNASWNGAVLTGVAGGSLTSVENVNANMGGGTDWLIYAAASAAVAVNLASGSASGFASISGIERVIGGNGNDTLTGDNFDNRLDGGAGDDVLNGGAGVDTLIGGDGDDVLAGGLGNDSIQSGAGADAINWTVGEGRDTIDGGVDVDTFNATGSGVAELGQATWNGAAITALMDNALSNIEAINLDLGGGVDWLIYNTSFGVTVNLATNSASGFASVTNIEKVIGGSGNDALTGDALDNRLDGQAGNDILDGGAGSDQVLGGDGDDTIYASAGNDSLQGQNGADTFHWTTADGRDTFNGGAGVDTVYLTGSAVADVADTNWNGATITGLLNNALIDIELVHLDLGDGGPGGDWLRYNTTFGVSVDLAAGTGTGYASIANVENLIGGTGGDALIGNAGANKINGAAGDDVIAGGTGNDNLTGGLGNDAFVYAPGAGADTINDFDAWADGGQDLLDISAFGVTAGDFAQRVAVIDVGADTVVRIDNDVFITLKNVTGDGDNSIAIDDFILA